MWTIHHRAFLPFNWTSIYQTVSAVNKKDSVDLNWPRPDSNMFLLLNLEWRALFFAGVDHPPPSLSFLYFVLDIPSNFAVSSKKKLTLTIVWLGPDSNRLFLLTVDARHRNENRCGPSTTRPFLPRI
jgi:hypothetical protein